MKYKKFNNKTKRIYVNRSIRASKVRCIDHLNVNHGVISFERALEMAENAGLDLIQVSDSRNQPPACKILDYGKYKYDMSKKEKELNKKQREAIVKVKEVKLRPNTEINDLQTKARHTLKFLEEGCKVKVVVRFKKHELRLPDVGFNKYYEFLETLNLLIKDQGNKFELKTCQNPALSGKELSAVWESSAS